MGETRVNLTHLLEDIRDSYPCPAEDVIILELIANSLDSGTSKIRITTDADARTFTITDNGKGMSEKDFQAYHDIAETSKVRGKGIGFAGVGVKLALLYAGKVETETKNKDFHKASRWWLESAKKAPWEYMDIRNFVTGENGTSVSIYLNDSSSLFDESHIEDVIQTYYYPLLHESFSDVLKNIYTKGVEIFINGRKIVNPPEGMKEKWFVVGMGRRKKPAGIGFIARSDTELPEEKRGIAISTFGKIIKRGWDWLGIIPRSPMHVTGIIEIPMMAELLTINKMDFLRDVNSLQKYYKYRKAIQETVRLVLQDMGEAGDIEETSKRDAQSLERELERILGNMLDDFPELSPLLGKGSRSGMIAGIIPDSTAPPAGTPEDGTGTMSGTEGGDGTGGGIDAIPGIDPGEHIEPSPEPTDGGLPHTGRRRRLGLMLGYNNSPERKELGWLEGTTLVINTGHSAYRNIERNEKALRYHWFVTVAWALSGYVESEKSPQAFIADFLSVWGGNL